MSASPVFGVTRLVIDFDGTINHDQGEDAAWRSDWILYRINGRTVGGQPSVLEFPPFSADSDKPALPPTLAISYGEYRKYLTKLGKEGDALGDLRTYPLFVDPLNPDRPGTFVPGYYRISPDITFQRFRPHPQAGSSYLLEDLQAAVARAKASRGRMKVTGRAFPLFQAALTNPELFADVVISTSRWHLGWEWDRALDGMWEVGLLRKSGRKGKPAKTTPVRVHSLSGPDGFMYARHTMSPRKAEVIGIEASTLVDGPLRTQKHKELAVDPVDARNGVYVDMNTLIAPEDDPTYVAAVAERMEKLSGDLGYAQNVKFVLWNVGSEADVAGAKYPWRWTVFHYGFGRPAREEEVAFWTGIKVPEDCKRLLAGDWVGGAK